ncbi:MAG TPA: MBL fold metallo-hydrolase [Blastocatellia bacterium]|nr:MBL fold metallo-hydrolase [Blastocatellia bacterium]
MYTIKAIRNFYVDFPVPGLAMYFQEKAGQTVEVCGYVWLIRGHGKTIVVDAGIGQQPAQDADGSQVIGNFTVAPGEDTASLLRREGVDPAEVDYLLLTHLHMDHCLNAPLFERAKILISHEGWESVARPKHRCMTPDNLFPRQVYAYLKERAWDRVELLEREQSVLPGIDIFYTGGHTPCSQAVTVETGAGRAVLTGDVVFL